jgi:hypothetical protein
MEHIEEGGDLAYLHKLTTYDRFLYTDDPILFFYNSDPQCKINRNLNVDEPSIVLYVDQSMAPFVLQGPNDDLSMNALFHWTSLSITQGRMKYGRRAASIMGNFKFNALVYLMA